MGVYTAKTYPYVTAPELRGERAAVYPVVIVGAGPVGLAAAIDLALHGIRCVVLDDNNTVSVGSRAICWSKRTLEIFDRLGVGERMVEKGVTWQIGRVFHGDQEIYSFNLLPEQGHKMPAFINLQQYYVEEYLVDRAAEFPDLIDLRWKNKVIGVRQGERASVGLGIEAPDGRYEIEASWVIAADGARSTVRAALGLPFEGEVFEEKFLIADIRMNADYPSDRRFWFRPSFDPGESVLIHRQPDSIFRIDFQLGWDADADAERRPERVAERVRRVVGPEIEFDLEWCSVYTFRCARLERFVHGRVLFAGDSAHVVSPFGARGGNGGIQDVDNLCWKLALVVKGEAPPSLLESYNEERAHGCQENIRHSSRTTRFMTPKTQAERQFRDGVLALAREFPFARALVNSGRLSRPCSLKGLRGVVADDGVRGAMAPGVPCADAPVTDARGRECWLLEFLGGEFAVVTFGEDPRDAQRCSELLRAEGLDLPLQAVISPVRASSGPSAIPGERRGAFDPAQRVSQIGADASDASEGRIAGRLADKPRDGSAPQLLFDREGLARERYGGASGVTYLIRPDQHVVARFATFDVGALAAAFARATGRSS